MAFLLDVNALIALLDPAHFYGAAMEQWFWEHHEEGWATCPIVENGCVRILATATYAGGSVPPSKTIATLQRLKAEYAQSHQFWDGISITDDTLIYPERLAGPNQITDAYLIALALHHGGRLLTFDRRLPWQAVRGATAEAIYTPSV